MIRDVAIRLLALIVALTVPIGAAAQATAQTPAEHGKAPAAKAAPASKAPAGPAAQKPVTPASKPPAAATARPVTPAVAPAVARPAAKPAAPAAALDAYSYRPEGRRDPFQSLVNRGTDPRNQRKAEGIAGMLAGDIVLKGILQSRGIFLAIVQGPDAKRQLIVRPSDRFADGVVKAITADTMVILQEVNDPLSLTKQREIRKTLRAVEEVK